MSQLLEGVVGALGELDPPAVSNAVNIRMSRFGVQFLREMGIALEERGYLYLGDEKTLRAVHAVQAANGAEIALLAPRELKQRFPWLNAATR